MSLAIEVIAIGNEILTGFTVNTNAAAIGQALLNIGLRVTAQRTLPDDSSQLKAGLQHSLNNFDLIICTGGLGPTCDDQTRQIIAELFDCELKFEPAIAEHLKVRYANRPVSIQDQAMIPSKAKYILNDIGTASALIFEEHGKLVLFLPGVPQELEYFMQHQIINLLKDKYQNQRTEFRQQCNFMQIAESQIDPTLRLLTAEFAPVEFGIYPNLGLISVHIISHLPTVDENLQFQAPIKERLIAAFPNDYFSDQYSKIEDVIIQTCIENSIKINVMQTSPYLSLGPRLAPVLTQETEAALIVTTSGLPEFSPIDQIYTADITIGLQLPSQAPVSKTLSIRGSKNMFLKRTENQILCQILRLIKTT